MDDRNWPQLGEFFTHARKRLSMTQEELADATPFGLRTISRAENGQPVSPKALRAMEEALGLPKYAADEVLVSDDQPPGQLPTPRMRLDRKDRWEVLKGLTAVAEFGEAAFTAALLEAAAARSTRESDN